jgi:hypothetical protein
VQYRAVTQPCNRESTDQPDHEKREADALFIVLRLLNASMKILLGPGLCQNQQAHEEICLPIPLSHTTHELCHSAQRLLCQVTGILFLKKG